MCNNKCWHSGCKKKGRINNGMGRWYCFEHWKSDYKYGIERGLKLALKHSYISIKRLLFKPKKCHCAAIKEEQKKN